MNMRPTEPTHGQLLRVVRRLGAFAPTGAEVGEGHLVPVPAAHLIEAARMGDLHDEEQHCLKVRAEGDRATACAALHEVRKGLRDDDLRGLIDDALDKIEGE